MGKENIISRVSRHVEVVNSSQSMIKRRAGQGMEGAAFKDAGDREVGGRGTRTGAAPT